MDRYEKAVRERDCEELTRLVYRSPGTAAPSCQEQLASTRRLARVLKADPGQRPAFQGGDDRFGFYGLTTYGIDDRTHHTFTLVKATIGGEPRFVVVDAVQDEPLKKPS